jgi:hypothetical protein
VGFATVYGVFGPVNPLHSRPVTRAAAQPAQGLRNGGNFAAG